MSKGKVMLLLVVVVVVVIVTGQSELNLIAQQEKMLQLEEKMGEVLKELEEKENLIRELEEKIIQQQQDYKSQNKIVKEQEEKLYGNGGYEFYIGVDIVLHVVGSFLRK